MIWLRVRFIKMFDMETTAWETIESAAAVDGSTAAGYSGLLNLGRGLRKQGGLIALQGYPRNTWDTSECREI